MHGLPARSELFLTYMPPADEPHIRRERCAIVDPCLHTLLLFCTFWRVLEMASNSQHACAMLYFAAFARSTGSLAIAIDVLWNSLPKMRPTKQRPRMKACTPPVSHLQSKRE